MRTVETRLEGPATTEEPPTPSSQVVEASNAYEESRVLLAEVRQRLDDTRARIADARSMAGEEHDGVNAARVGDGTVQARQGLDRTVAFATRYALLPVSLRCSLTFRD